MAYQDIVTKLQQLAAFTAFGSEKEIATLRQLFQNLRRGGGC